MMAHSSFIIGMEISNKIFHPEKELKPLLAEPQRFFQLGPLISLQVMCKRQAWNGKFYYLVISWN